MLSAACLCSRGPGDLNGYGYFYVRLYRTDFGLPANVVEEYILLSVLLHVVVGLKRTWDMKLALAKSQGAQRLGSCHLGPEVADIHDVPSLPVPLRRHRSVRPILCAPATVPDLLLGHLVTVLVGRRRQWRSSGGPTLGVAARSSRGVPSSAKSTAGGRNGGWPLPTPGGPVGREAARPSG